jgi:hypothetical protein
VLRNVWSGLKRGEGGDGGRGGEEEEEEGGRSFPISSNIFLSRITLGPPSAFSTLPYQGGR